MTCLLGVDLVLGVAAIFAVPFHRATAFAPDRGRAVYLAHAVLGLVLTAGAVALVERTRSLDRHLRVAAITGLVGLGVSGAGGVLAVLQATRLVGMALMLLGSIGAAAGYVMPLVDEDEGFGQPSSSPDRLA